MTESQEIKRLKEENAALRLYAPARRSEPSPAIVKGLENANTDFDYWGIKIKGDE